MAKRLIISIILTYIIVAPAFGQDEQNAKPKAEVYLITQFYHKLADTVLNLKEEFGDTSTYLTILPRNDGTCLIVIDHGDVESVKFFGKAEGIENPGFDSTRDDAEFYLWNYISADSSDEMIAFVFKEYVTGSLEEGGSKYFFFSILFSLESEFQIYAKMLEY